MRERYRKKTNQAVIAVQLNLDLSAFIYQKWGGEQHAKRGDWLVDNGGEVYTVEHSSFAQTYQRVRPGMYLKTTPVWAELAIEPGAVQTKEGQSHYVAGDYLVSNNVDGTDAYCMSADRFEAMYQRDE